MDNENKDDDRFGVTRYDAYLKKQPDPEPPFKPIPPEAYKQAPDIFDAFALTFARPDAFPLNPRQKALHDERMQQARKYDHKRMRDDFSFFAKNYLTVKPPKPPVPESLHELLAEKVKAITHERLLNDPTVKITVRAIQNKYTPDLWRFDCKVGDERFVICCDEREESVLETVETCFSKLAEYRLGWGPLE